MTEGFLRQRRNLFVVNAIFLFCFYAQVNVSKLSIAGMSFDGFGNPEAVYIFLWIAWAYFLYRFVVFFIEDEKKTFRNTWEREFGTRVSKVIKKIIANEEKEELNEGCSYGYYQLKTNNWVLPYQIWHVIENNERRVQNRERKFRRREVLISEIGSFLYFSFLTPILTNYLLPLLVCLYVFLVCGFFKWEGSLIHAIT